MISGVTVVHATEQDWERVRAARLAALQDTPDAFCSTFQQESGQAPEWWQARLRQASVTTLLAIGNQTDAGLAVVAVNPDSHDAWLCAVWVSPAHRGKGVGDALIRAAASCARGRGALRLLLEVGQLNPAATALYLRNGFVKTGRLSTLPPPREHIIEVELALDLT